MTPDNGTVTASAQRATAREFFAVVFRRRWIILGLFVVTTLTVMAVAATTPTVYMSSGQVLVRRGEQESIFNPMRRLMNEWEIELGSEIETVKSWPVLQRTQQILDEEGQGRRPVKIQGGQVEVEVTGRSNVLAIGYTDRDPDVAQRVCDAILRAYIGYRQSEQLAYPRRFFDTEIAQAAAELRRWTELRRRYANEQGIVDLVEQRRNLIALRGVLEQKRTETLAELAEAESEQRLMRELRDLPEVDFPAIGEPGQSGDQATLDIKRRVVAQEARIAELRERYRDESTEVENAMVTLDTLRAMLEREVEARLAGSHSSAEVIRARLDVVERDLAEVEAKLRTLPDKEARLAEMNHEIDSWTSRYDELVQSSDQARVNENTVPLISVYLLNPAGPARPRNARDYVRLALAPAFSLLVGIGLAFFIDGLDLTVHTAGQVEEEIELPVLAALTDRKKAFGRRPQDPRKAPT
jgi:uncharacterized protein involved in exopolysaccharide biosynthesis